MLASGNYDGLFLLSYALLGIYVLAAPGFIPLLAIGLLNPFVLPIPFVHQFPFLLLILGICCVKLFLWKAMSQQGNAAPYKHCFTVWFALFFAWVVLRYCMNPVMPNISGFGQNVTGFRAYLNYGVCFGLVLLLPLFLTSHEDVLRLLRWMTGISIFFILFLTPFIFTKSLNAAMWLNRFGLYVTFFDNGWLRLIVLPHFGMLLVMFSSLPGIMPVSLRLRVILLALGAIAIVMGGNRSTLLMTFISVLTIAWLRRRFLIFNLLIAAIAFSLIAFHYIGERIDIRSGAGFLRILSLTSRRVAQETGAAGTFEWRKIRWNRALEEIKSYPVFGKGYGGLENAWIFADIGEYEAARLEVDMASGGLHNGYLTCAYSLGIPALLLFIIGVGSQILRNAIQAWRLGDTDPLPRDFHVFVCANLLGLVASIYIGADLNVPVIWFYLALGVLLTRLGLPKQTVPQPEPRPVQPRISLRPLAG
jgi:O-antigen ligase